MGSATPQRHDAERKKWLAARARRRRLDDDCATTILQLDGAVISVSPKKRDEREVTVELGNRKRHCVVAADVARGGLESPEFMELIDGMKADCRRDSKRGKKRPSSGRS